ncbi:MAG: DrmB family protein [Pirellulales bacterium]
MGNKQVRIGQLIAPFGPGSLYTDRRGTPHIVCGLDHWFLRWDQALGLVPCENRAEFERIEPRLSALLHVDRFCMPPDYRYVRRGMTAPPNAMLNVPALRFPCWYRHTRSGEMRRFNLHTSRIENPVSGGRWQPVRFVSVCAGGHLCEFPWKEWIGCQCSGDGNLSLTDRGGSELSSIRIECKSCPPDSSGRKGRTLAGTTIKPDIDQGEQSAFQRAGITCPGDRPWLGEGANELGCAHPLIGALINQTNLYFPRTISAIALPDLKPRSATIATLRNAIESDPAGAGVAMTYWKMGRRKLAVAAVGASLDERGIQSDPAQVEEVLANLFDLAAATLPAGAQPPADPESELLAFRRAEFNIIRNQVDDPEHMPNLCVILTNVPSALSQWFARVNLVERLKETRVFYGFDRLEQNNTSLAGMPDTAMRQLFRQPPAQPQDRWLPAVEVFGEGIYIELHEQRLLGWQNDHADWIAERIDDGFLARLAGVSQTLPPSTAVNRNWASRYLMVHSLAHILINQLVFECGYNTASLRERLYISADPAAPMAAFLIYTAAGDSEGTLGGLVRLGRPERLGPVVQRALGRASWCSADPVCSEQLGGQGSKLANLAACHACVLLPETSCETINQGLDRAMVVGTPENREPGFLASMLEQAYVFD